MARFFKDDVAGILILGVVGSLLAAWLGQIIPSPVSDGAWWRSLLFLPVPAFVLLCYSAFLVFGVVAITNRWRAADQERFAAEREAKLIELATVTSERDRWRGKYESLKRSPVSSDSLMRFVAVALSDRADGAPRTHLNVCRIVAGLAGEGVPHHDISDALGSMLQAGAVRSNFRQELELASDWQEKLIGLRNRAAG